MKTYTFLAAGLTALIVDALPVKAGQYFDNCIQSVGQGAMDKFSSYENVTSFCKCFEYVIVTSMSQEQMQHSGMMVLLGAGQTPELMQTTYKAKQKCSVYMR